MMSWLLVLLGFLLGALVHRQAQGALTALRARRQLPPSMPPNRGQLLLTDWIEVFRETVVATEGEVPPDVAILLDPSAPTAALASARRAAEEERARVLKEAQAEAEAILERADAEGSAAMDRAARAVADAGQALSSARDRLLTLQAEARQLDLYIFRTRRRTLP